MCQLTVCDGVYVSVITYWFIFILLQQGEIDAREDSFRSTVEAGQRLVDANHYAADEVRDKVSSTTLITGRKKVLKGWGYNVYSIFSATFIENYLTHHYQTGNSFDWEGVSSAILILIMQRVGKH